MEEPIYVVNYKDLKTLDDVIKVLKAIDIQFVGVDEISRNKFDNLVEDGILIKLN